MADTYALLADTRERLAQATGGRRDQLSDDAFDAKEIAQLSYDTGIPQAQVIELLNGGRVPQTSTSERVRQRLEFLRSTRRREDGSEYTQAELGKIAGVSRQTLSSWFGKVAPPMDGADRLRRHFGVSAGFLTADEPEALAEALQPKLLAVQATMGSLPQEFLDSEPLRRIATRAPLMPPGVMEQLADWADTVTRPRD